MKRFDKMLLSVDDSEGRKIFAAIENEDFKFFETGFDSDNLTKNYFHNFWYEINPPSGKCCYKRIRDINPIVCCILLEKHKLLDFLLNTYHPKLSFYCNEWAAIHYACCTGSYKCLQVLLNQPYIQENIDIPVLDRFDPQPECRTTALHIAVTNKCYAQAILLTMPLPKLKDGREYQPANATQKSSFGNTPLHIAVYNNDWKMCQILMNSCDDLTINNNEKCTPIKIAKRNRNTELADLLCKNEIAPIEDFLDEYIPDYKPQNESEEDKETEEIKTKSQQEQIEEMSEQVDSLISQIQSLTSRIIMLS